MGKFPLTEWGWSHYDCFMVKLHPHIEALLVEIDDFRDQTAINQTNFGMLSVKDGKFLSDLGKGRLPSLATIDKVRAFMADRRGVPA